MSSKLRAKAHRSYCPIHHSLEIFGDRWTLLILRDMMFGGKRHFRELLQADEQISTNILAVRLKMLVREGLLTTRDDPSHSQKVAYSLTDKAIDLLPIILQIGAWGTRWLPETQQQDPAAREYVQRLQAQGPAGWKKLMAELRRQHLEA